MVFTSFQFIFFFIVTWILWFFLKKQRIGVLFIAGIIFIGSLSWVSVLLCLLLSVLNFRAGLALQKNYSRGFYLLLQCLNVGLIPVGNYLSAHTLSFAIGAGEDLSRLFVTAGLSFYGLQHYAYLNDVSAKRVRAEEDALFFLFGSTYFLKFLSGPITRYDQIKDSLSQQQTATVKAFPALNRILIGYFKKMVIADALAPSVSSAFDYGDPLPGLTIFAGAVLFTIQLYFDFSGYCDIVIGCSSLLGIQLPENFSMPLRATSMTRFWRRWHITLLDFFTKYVFYPLSFSMRKCGRLAAGIGVLAVFVLSAAWHGFGLTFLAWGFCHALFILVEHYLVPAGDKKSSIKNFSGTVLVIVLFSFSNIFFRSQGWDVCESLMARLFDVGNFLPLEWSAGFLAPLAVGGHQIDQFNFYILILMAGVFLFFEERITKFAGQDYFRPLPAFVLLLIIFVFGVFASGQRFIYMQF